MLIFENDFTHIYNTLSTLNESLKESIENSYKSVAEIEKDLKDALVDNKKMFMGIVGKEPIGKTIENIEIVKTYDPADLEDLKIKLVATDFKQPLLFKIVDFRIVNKEADKVVCRIKTKNNKIFDLTFTGKLGEFFKKLRDFIKNTKESQLPLDLSKDEPGSAFNFKVLKEIPGFIKDTEAIDWLKDHVKSINFSLPIPGSTSTGNRRDRREEFIAAFGDLPYSYTKKPKEEKSTYKTGIGVIFNLDTSFIGSPVEKYFPEKVNNVYVKVLASLPLAYTLLSVDSPTRDVFKDRVKAANCK